jgi:predicted ABC-type ATPase
MPRLRIFAGPNGSGKSTLYEAFAKRYETGVFLNADLIEKELSVNGFIDLSDFGLELIQNDLDIFLGSERAKTIIEKSNIENHIIDFSLNENKIFVKNREGIGYEGSLICSLLKLHLLEKKEDFCFETVMSHSSKLNDISEAKSKGYKTYLYFICIDDPLVNISRVENRVNKGGHGVDSKKVESRYYRTLENLISAIELAEKCYLFDNSKDEFTLIATAINNNLKLQIEPKALPNWFKNYVLMHYEI